MRDGWLIWNELSLRDVLTKAFGLPVSNAMGVERNATNPVPQGRNNLKPGTSVPGRITLMMSPEGTAQDSNADG